MKTLLLSILLLASSPDEELIIIQGKRTEATRETRGGQSLSVRPKDESRFESLTHLKRESSVLVPETGRISASGFVVPKIRGQDVKLTDVYLEDILVQDPYSGLPLIEDLDLRAFGVLELHQGMSPPDVPGNNPIGTLRYRFRPEKSSRAQVGLQGGEPFGLSVWGLGVHRVGDDDYRLYGRQHASSGRYRYYSDESTPYNSRDDRMRTRENNDQRSIQAVPYLKKSWGPYSLQGLGWIYQADRGLPSASVLQSSGAREKTAGHIAHVQLSRELEATDFYSRGRWSFGLANNQDDRRIQDPQRSYLGAGDRSEMDIDTLRLQSNLSLAGENWDQHLAADFSQTHVENRAGSQRISDLDRSGKNLSLGSRFLPLPLTTVEAKFAWRELQDDDKGVAANAIIAEENAKKKKRRDSTSWGLSVALNDDFWAVYLQAAGAQRLPSLLEEYGNGSSIQPNPSLKAENIEHREAGASLQGQDWSLGTAVYQDRTQDKIVFIPILASSSKALNVRKTVVRGIDLRGEYQWGNSSFYAGVSRLYPYDTTRDAKKILPAIPEKVAVFEWRQSFGERTTARWFSRYRSDVFRDLNNTVRIPGAWIHDLSADQKLSLRKTNDLALGFSLRNVFNVTDLPISAPGTESSKGRTGYSDIAGFPLPGRQWLLSLSYEF